MIAANLLVKGALAYPSPSFRYVVLRQVRRSLSLQSSHSSSFRYLTNSTTKKKGLSALEIAENAEENKNIDSVTPTSTTNNPNHLRDQEVITSTKQPLDIAATTTASDLTTPSTNAFWSRPILRSLRRAAGGAAATIGFVSSAATSILTDRAQFRRTKPTVQALTRFLETSGISLELSPSLNVHLMRNILVLGRMQKILVERNDRREQTKTTTKVQKIPSIEEAKKYMRYATAAYGSQMITAAEMGARGIFNAQQWGSPITKARISEHIGIPEEDIVISDVEHDGDINHLRHLVAVDHANQKVVLSIRGTFNLSEIIVDVAAFSRPCFGGEAHSAMMTMAQRVWNRSGSTVRRLLQENEGYELILTGHSLGAGTACLLNIMCHNDKKKMIDDRPVRCFAYASPPVFSPLEIVPQAVQSTTNYIHEKDIVPFLSVDSVRHAFNSVRAVEEYMNKLGRVARYKLTAGFINEKDDKELMETVLKASRTRLKPIAGAPNLVIPAAANVWIREVGESGEYDFEICDAKALANLGLQIDFRMMEDHFPPQYEHAFDNLKEETKK